MSHDTNLTSYGFKRLPDLDPEYFLAREGVGYLVLVNEQAKKYYHVFTYNARLYIASICRCIDGSTREIAVELASTLRGTRHEDWCVYFRAGVMNPRVRPNVELAMNGFTKIIQGAARIDTNAGVEVWVVSYEPYSYSRLIVLPPHSEQEDAVAAFLKLWRKMFQAALRENSITLTQYYRAAEQQARAFAEWNNADTQNYRVGKLESLGIIPRKEATFITSTENIRSSSAYLESLYSATSAARKPLGIEQ